MAEPVQIIGAGIAGLTAAITLRRAGREVVVHEAGRRLGHRFHGDFEGIENWSTREDALDWMRSLGLAVNFEATPFHTCDFYGPDDRCRRFETRAPLFYLVRRGGGPGSIEAGLGEQAGSLGARVELGSRVEHLPHGGIVATGPKAADAIADGILFETDAPDQAAAIVNDELAPGGYAYRLVHAGRGTLATCMFRDFERHEECREKAVAAFARLAPISVRDIRPFGGFGNRFFRDPVQRGDRLYVGEAAGAQDALWGFGMRLAMLSGHLAAQSLITGADYRRLFARQLRPRMDACLITRVLFDRLGNAGFAAYLDRPEIRRDPREALRRFYAPGFWKSVISLWARRRYHSRLIDRTCGHVASCDCAWCRFCRERAASVAEAA